ncbi:hypothetical protein AHAS_Ahas01G0214800 [Arachis hypogaea]
MVAHKKLMTSQRKDRLFGASSFCHICSNTKKNLSHVLRDCQAISTFWAKIIAPSHLQSFFRAPFDA